jgi:hypothetical protein
MTQLLAELGTRRNRDVMNAEEETASPWRLD